jgi:NADH:ubiquinone oxidoreductase subunit E
MLVVNICVGSSCHLKGAYGVIQTLRRFIEEEALQNTVEMKAQFCMQRCQEGVSVSIEGEPYSVSPDTAGDFFRNVIATKLAGSGA